MRAPAEVWEWMSETPMDESRQNAYRYLLYWAICDIRQVAWLRFRWWNPLSWSRNQRRVRIAGETANWLHNLALYASLDFESFDEGRFWVDGERLKKLAPQCVENRYQHIFEHRLAELNESG